MLVWLKKNWFKLCLLTFAIVILDDILRHGYGGNYPWILVAILSVELIIIIILDIYCRKENI